MPAVLRSGSRGDDVERLQQRLLAAGFSPGRIDGRFGPATEAALVAFQRAHGLLADGICGPASWAALEAGEAPPLADITGQVEVETVARMFPFTRLDAISRNLPGVLGALAERGLGSKPMVLAALATIRAESEGFEPISELPSRFNTSPDGRPFDLYDHRRDLGNRGPDDGERFRGRGFVQLTGRANYAEIGEAMGLGNGLVAAPERANAPEMAAQILAAFLKTRELSLKQALLEGDLKRARRMVNGGLHGLDRFTEAYRIGDRLIDDPVWRAAGAEAQRVEA